MDLIICMKDDTNWLVISVKCNYNSCEIIPLILSTVSLLGY